MRSIVPQAIRRHLVWRPVFCRAAAEANVDYRDLVAIGIGMKVVGTGEDSYNPLRNHSNAGLFLNFSYYAICDIFAGVKIAAEQGP